MALVSSQGWWELEEYPVDQMFEALEPYAGPNGVAVVKAFDNGRTSSGWGLKGKDGTPEFMPIYRKSGFVQSRLVRGYQKDLYSVAVVMRSTRLVCIDIDGKNGGLQAVRQLGPLPYTLAETSKSGTGYHLFYSLPDEWDDTVGFDMIPDQIGIVQGVDIRGVGCVYHFQQQRWNTRAVAEAPDWLIERLLVRKRLREKKRQATQLIIESGDPIEMQMLHTSLLSDLAADIPAGRRNNTIFAIGTELKNSQYPQWEDAVRNRGAEVGMGDAELHKIGRAHV